MMKLFMTMLLLPGSILWGLNNEVGEILSFQGKCLIDSFGTGEFISPQQGDKLYVTTKLETLEKGTMDIRIFKDHISIPEETQFSLESYMKINQKSQSENWFSPMWDLIQRAADSLFHDEEHIDLVTRGREYIALNSQFFAWQDDSDVSSYGEEIQFLKYLLANHGRLDAETGEVLFEDNSMEIFYLMGAVHLKNRNFQAAVEKLEKSLAIMIHDEKEPVYKQKMYLFLAIAYYFSDNSARAREVFKQLDLDKLDRESRIIVNWLMEAQYLDNGSEVPLLLLKQLNEDLAGEEELRQAHSLFLKAKMK
ncbi:MAG: hypothetical protein JXR70_04170 [Spirochaetales bacterium]|nr:hypothetical protein [Spirochaetales bacterium]